MAKRRFFPPPSSRRLYCCLQQQRLQDIRPSPPLAPPAHQRVWPFEAAACRLGLVCHGCRRIGSRAQFQLAMRIPRLCQRLRRVDFRCEGTALARLVLALASPAPPAPQLPQRAGLPEPPSVFFSARIPCWWAAIICSSSQGSTLQLPRTAVGMATSCCGAHCRHRLLPLQSTMRCLMLLSLVTLLTNNTGFESQRGTPKVDHLCLSPANSSRKV